MRQLPTGTVTFLFTDIEGSTRLLQELGDAYAEALTEHRRVLREAFGRHGGVEVDTQGDAFFVAFARAGEALAAAAEAQAALDGPIRVRMGLHTGEPLVTEQGYVGIDVHRAARIAAVGHGGQVLISAATRALLAPSNTVLLDLGEHRLKDLTAPERIYQLGEGQFPPLKSLNATNLPVAANPLVGRGRELGELVGLLTDSSRVVTVTGTGGTGKTRLALQVAGELIEEFPGGVFFVPLAGVPEADLVEATIASTIGVRSLEELRDRHALLLVDNFEHVLEAASALSRPLTQATDVKLLVTSRAPLRIEGEREYPLEPLPDDEAVVLLTERARAVRPDFQPDEATREICRRLDGLPLALELAAARLRSLGSETLLERLEQRLPVLTSGRRDAPERQRSLRATIEWSYDLLEPELQAVFARLAVFATFSLEAADEVAGADLDAVDALVEASLLKHLGADRYLMLETIREYALERLEAAGEVDATRLRQLEYLTRLGRSANLSVEAEGPMRHDLVIPERDNIRTALEWALAAGEAERGLELVAALENYWVSAGDSVGGRRWIEALLEAAPDLSPWLHAYALRCLANCTSTISGDRVGAAALYEESAARFEEAGDELRAATAHYRTAMQIQLQDPERARRLNEQSHDLFRRIGFAKGEAGCFTFLGDFERNRGAPERSLSFYERGIELAHESGFTWWEMGALLKRALVLFDLGRPAEAGRDAAEALRVSRRIEDRVAALESLALLARAAVEQGDEELAGRLWGAVEAEVERVPVPGWEIERDELAEPILARAEAVFEAGYGDGRTLVLDDAVELALHSVRTA